MKYRFARSSSIALMALLPACGGGDFTKTAGNGDRRGRPDAAVDGLSGGGTTSDGGSTGSGGNRSSGGSGAGGSGDGGRGSGGNDGAGGSVGTGGSASVDAGAAGADAAAGSGGTSNDGGTASGGVVGAGGSCPDPTVWYVDADQDGYGSTTDPTVKSCSQPMGHYTKVGGDCHDGYKQVHPQVGQQIKDYFSVPYKALSGGDSYDYDCSGVETGDPSQLKASTCALLMIGSGPTCGGTGYFPSNRGGSTANAYCGSQKFQTCTSNGLTCSGTTAADKPPYRCN